MSDHLKTYYVTVRADIMVYIEAVDSESAGLEAEAEVSHLVENYDIGVVQETDVVDVVEEGEDE